MPTNAWPVSLDVGNALCKGVRANATPIVFPNLVATDRNNILRDFTGFTSKEPLIVEIEGERWAVGESAADLSRTPRAQVGYARYNSPDFKALVAGLLGEMYPNKSGTIALTFSLPVDGFGQAAQQIRRLAGTWEVTVKGRRLTFELPADLMLPVPEAFGSVCYFMLSEDGTRIVDVELAESRIAVIDIGGYTTDVLTFRDLSLTPTYGSVERGVLQVKEDINKEIKHRFNRHDLDPRDVDKIMKPDKIGKYYYRHAGVLEDVTGIVEEAVWELTTGVLNVWTNQLRSGVDYDVVIITGGGAPVIRPFLESRIEHGNIMRVDDRQAHLANALGAWRFAAFRRANA
jgi:hypothetical protein